MKADVVLLPKDLAAGQDDLVVVLDVLRATTSLTVALAAGAREIRIFDDVEGARRAAAGFGGAKLLAGEAQCLPPAGFDLGNSPAGFAACAGATVFMATTNGTRAIVAAQGAKTVLIGALVNAGAVAKRLLQLRGDVKLLCAGTNGQVAMEDVIGAGAVLNALRYAADIDLASDIARMALGLFRAAADDLHDALAQSQGGQNVINAGLPADVEFAARLNSIPVVGVVEREPLRVVRA